MNGIKPYNIWFFRRQTEDPNNNCKRRSPNARHALAKMIQQELPTIAGCGFIHPSRSCTKLLKHNLMCFSCINRGCSDHHD